MMNRNQNKKIPNPYVEHFLWNNAKDELRALLLFIRYQWYVVLIAVLVVALLVSQLNPIPPSSIRLATGQPNSTLEILGKKYQETFKKYGVAIELIPSRGANDSLDLLRAKKADVALSQGGQEILASSGVVSLGSIGYQPLWLFYSGPEFTGEDMFEYLKNKRVYIGVPGSGTRMMVDTLLKEVGQLDRPTFRPEAQLSAKDSVDALLSGRLDAVFLIAGYESGNAQALFRNPKVNILSFPIAEALARRIDHVEIVEIPRGSISLSPVWPKSDIKMAATTTVLLARNDLHHAIQNLLLTSSKEIYNSERYFFDRPGGFPVFVDKKTPRSAIAEKFYSRGPPFLTGRAPYWVASFIDLAWLSLLTVLAIAYPLFRLVPSYRKYIYLVFSSALYAEIFRAEQALYEAKTAEEFTRCRGSILAISQKVRDVWVPKGAFEAHGFLIAALEVLIMRANIRFERNAVEIITG